MKNVTVLFVYHSLNSGGAEKEMLAYIRNLPMNSYAIHLALTRVTGELLPEVPEHVRIHEIPGDSIRPDLSHLLNLYRLIRKVRPDIVTGFMQDINFNILFLRQIFGLGYKTVVSEQIVLSGWQRLMKTGFLKSHLISWLYKKASIIAAQSESIRNDLIGSYAIEKTKVRVIPSYIIPSDYTFSPKPRKHTFFLYMGHLAPEKNIELLLSAFQRVHRQNPGARLKLVGSGPSESYMERIAALGLEKAVRIVPFTKMPDIYYRRASALIIPSPVEGRSRVMIEAMLSGCPVLTSDFIGHELYIRHNKTGLVFRKDSAEDVSDALQYAFEHPDRMGILARRAHVFITKVYSHKFGQSYARKIHKLYTDVLQ